jgi:hypothetical protein
MMPSEYETFKKEKLAINHLWKTCLEEDVKLSVVISRFKDIGLDAELQISIKNDFHARYLNELDIAYKDGYDTGMQHGQGRSMFKSLNIPETDVLIPMPEVKPPKDN